MKRFTLLLGVMFLSGCSEKTDSVPPAGKQEPLIVLQNHEDTSQSSGIEGPTAFQSTSTPGDNGEISVNGILKGAWLRQQSGTTLGEISKATLSNPLRLIAGGRSLALLGETEEMEQTLLKNSGKTVRLTGHLITAVEHGRGVQNPQGGYTGAIPAHLIQFLSVSDCEVINGTPE